MAPTTFVRSSVNVGGVEVVFYDNSGAEAHQNTQVAVNNVIAGGHNYTADTAVDVWGYRTRKRLTPT